MKIDIHLLISCGFFLRKYNAIYLLKVSNKMASPESYHTHTYEKNHTHRTLLWNITLKSLFFFCWTATVFFSSNGWSQMNVERISVRFPLFGLRCASFISTSYISLSMCFFFIFFVVVAVQKQNKANKTNISNRFVGQVKEAHYHYKYSRHFDFANTHTVAVHSSWTQSLEIRRKSGFLAIFEMIYL